MMEVMEPERPIPNADAVRIINSFRDPTQTYLESPWTLWLVNKTDAQNKTWLQCIHPIATFSTIQQFWGMYNSLKPPSELPASWEYALFRGGLGRRVIVPDWDDHENVGGGCMQSTGFNLETKIVDHLWRDICLKVIEEAWIHTSDYINGILVSCKPGTTRFYVWVAACKEHVWEDVRERIEGVFSQDCRTPLKWTPHTERKSERNSKVAAAAQRAAAISSQLAAEALVKRPHVIRSRSVGFRSKIGHKLEEDIRTEEFLAAKRRSLLESKEKAASRKLLESFKAETNNAPAAFRVTGSASFTHSFNQPMYRRGRSCHGQRLKALAEYPVHHAQRDRSRCHGDGDLSDIPAVAKLCCPHNQCDAQTSKGDQPAKSIREMIDVSTQFSTRSNQLASGDGGGGDGGGGDSCNANKGD